MLIFTIIILVYILFLFITPKRTNVHEVLHIPIFWLRSFFIKKDNVITRKISFGKHRQQYLLFYEPKKNKANKQHIILFYHGGGWVSGSPEILKAAAQFFADQGYISVFSNYRKAPFHSHTEMREDLTLGIQVVENLKQELNLGDKKIIIGGMSAGANLAALLAFQKEELEKIKYDSQLISGVFLCGPPIDIDQMKWSIPLHLFAGKRGADKFYQANPVNHFSKNKDLPILIIHGKQDGLVPYHNVISFLKKTKTTNAAHVQLFTMEEGTHMRAASWSYEDNEVRQVILAWLAEREKEI